MKRSTRARAALIAIGLAALLATLVPSVQGSPPARKVATARGSLQFTVNPSPACIPETTSPGSCDFGLKWRLKVKSAPACRGRDVKIQRLDPPANGFTVNTPGTNHRGSRAETNTYTAAYPGVPLYQGQPLDAYSAWGGSHMSFRAVAPRFKTFVANNPLRPLVCKTLRSSIEDVVAPMPPPPAN